MRSKRGRRAKRRKRHEVTIVEEPPMTAEQMVMDEAMSNPLIMKEILSFLSIQDLCKCSLVSRYWNFHAREVLRDVKHCLACIEEENSCRDLKRLNTVLENSIDVPFCGLAISCPWSYYNHKCVKYKDLSEFTESLLNKVKIRFLAIDCERKLNCASVHSIKRIFQATCTHLEALSVEKLPLFVLTLSEFLGYRAPLETLYNMKELDFPCDYDEDGLPESVVKELVTAAPNLKRLTGNITPPCLEFILPLGKVAAVKDFNLEATEANLPMCLKFAKEQPKLEKLRFSSAFEDDDDAPIIFNWSEHSILRLAEVLGLLLESSKDTLTDLAVDHLDLILLIRFGLPVLNKLKRLTLTFSESVDRREGYCTLRRINFEKYFPKLQWVQIRFSYFQNESFYIKDEFRENKQEYTCSTVNTLVFSPILRNVNVSQVGRFAELFPAVKNFYIHRCDKLATFLGALWTSWPDLETMTFLTVEDRVAKNNLDPVFCGITKKEANALKAFEGDLDKFQLVPVRPSIRNLTKLRALRIEIRHFGDCRRNDHPNHVFLSEVTTRCAFGKMPEFTVEIDRELCKSEGVSCCFCLDHLKPYVKFTGAENWDI